MNTDNLILNLVNSIADEERLTEFHRQRHDFHRARAVELRAMVSRLEEIEVDETVSEKGLTMLGSQRIGPSKAILELFQSEPDRAWTPRELLDALKIMKRFGQLDSAAVELLPSIHTILARLLAKGKIEPTLLNDGKAYRLK